MSLRGERGATLVEMIVVIVVVGMAIPALMTNFATVSTRSLKSEAVGDATFYAEQLLEEIGSKAFVDPDYSGNTALGPNNGESYPGYNDVDDFANFSQVNGPFTTTVTVNYANLSGTDWTTVTSATDYKLVTVTVRNARNMVNAVMNTLISKR